MPRRSKRKLIVQQILLKSVIDIIWAKNEKEVDDELFNCSNQIVCVLKHRYLAPRTSVIPKSTDWYINILPEYDSIRFKSCLRVTRLDFANILQIISESQTFKTTSKMIPVDKQLAIALYRFGCDGSGVSYYKIGQLFGASDGGTILNSTERVIKSLLEREKDIISWPSVDERRLIINSMEDKLPGCLGYVDGCHIVLFEAPKDNHESYFSRKQQYGLQLQAVCDNDLLIRSITVGYPASAHDARVFANSPIGMHPRRFFEPGEWIAGDSAYKLSATVITPFRDNSTFGTAAQRKTFNRYFSSFRVKIEHTFGILKKVFGSLKCLRIRVDAGSGHRRACQWIMACCILYNIIKPIEEPEDEFEDDDEECSEEASAGGEELRKDLFNWINEL